MVTANSKTCERCLGTKTIKDHTDFKGHIYGPDGTANVAQSALITVPCPRCDGKGVTKTQFAGHIFAPGTA